jgi:uncharacterized protein (TIGR03086 family)
VLERTVHLSYGDVPAEEYAWQMTMDALVHGWDLARGIGANESLDPETATAVYQMLQPMKDDLAASGMFAAPIDVPESAPIAERLLALLGRRV